MPQFIEEEAKIIGPLVFKQIIYLGIAAVVCFILYFSVPFFVFLFGCVILMGGGMALAFLKIGGKSLPSILTNLLKFSLTSKIYIWKKSEQPAVKIYKKKIEPPKLSEEELPLKIAEKSRLKKLQTEIETKTK